MSSIFNQTSSILLLINLIIFLLFVYLAIRSIQGKRVDDHPLCRKCKYDLIGTPTPYSFCSECGYSLMTSKHISIGNRKKQPYRAAVFTFFAILSLLPVTVQSMDVNINRYKPFRLLLFEYMNPQFSPDVEAVHLELMTRISPADPSLRLSDSQFNQLFIAMMEQDPKRINFKVDKNFYTMFTVLKMHSALTTETKRKYFSFQINNLLNQIDNSDYMGLAKQHVEFRNKDVLTDELLLETADLISAQINQTKNKTKYSPALLCVLLEAHQQNLLSEKQQKDLISAINRFTVTANATTNNQQSFLNFKLHIDSNFLFYMNMLGTPVETGHQIINIRGYYLNDQFHPLVIPQSTPSIKQSFQLPFNYGGGFVRNYPNISWPFGIPKPKETDTLSLDLEITYVFDASPTLLTTNLKTDPITISRGAQEKDKTSTAAQSN
ncbi:FlxA-like family protein [Planctomycetota bacterium]|nr:FlxA-like family protein [Planctomycetota bacterium]